MLRKATLAAASLALSASLGLGLPGPAMAAGHAAHPKEVDWTFDGPLGKFDQAQLQRGFKVYREVCASCHAMHLLSFRNLGEKHGPFYDAEHPNPNDNPYVKAIAAEYQINDIDSETGDDIQRPGTSADRFPSPFRNEAAARASNGGALPPDLSVIAKARHGGASYIYSLLTGYVTPPAGLNVPAGQHYNPYMAGDLSGSWTGPHDKVPHGGFIAMPQPLKAGQVTFDDGKPSTIEQEAKDVSAFLAWASEPKQTERKQTGLAVMIYLLLLAGLVYASYRRVWRNESH
jgi:ubiquinol-cytochrome c reductase cytochrome c1 subunit